jgi:hypothetical protein
MVEKKPNVKKKHHYVAQFYLRNFALPGSDRQIAVYRIPDDKFIARTAIRDQAHENHFYREQFIEDGLSLIEGAVAGDIEAAVSRETLPTGFTEGHHRLVAFAFIQVARTPTAADEVDAKATALFHRMAAGHPDLSPEELEMIEIRSSNAPAVAMGVTAELLPFTFDLHYKLLCNRTTDPFVTSDHPAVLYNQFLEPRRKEGSNTGLAIRGLQLFLPIGPRHTLVFYDKDVYKVGGRRETSTRVDVTNKADVWSLNLLQAVNAAEHLYFNHEVTPTAARELVRKAARYRHETTVVTREYQPRNPRAGAQGVLLKMFHPDVRTHLSLRCVRISPHADKYHRTDGGIAYRNPALVAAMDQRTLERNMPPIQYGEFVPADGSGPGITIRNPLPTGRP